MILFKHVVKKLSLNDDDDLHKQRQRTKSKISMIKKTWHPAYSGNTVCQAEIEAYGRLEWVMSQNR